MPNEELSQRGYFSSDGLVGERFGSLELLNLGSTSFTALARAGLQFAMPSQVDFPFSSFVPPARIGSGKPDLVVARRTEAGLKPEVVIEHKAPAEINTKAKQHKAAEQAIFYGAVLGARLAGYSNGTEVQLLDVPRSIESGAVVRIEDTRAWGPSMLEDLLSAAPGEVKDPTELAESVWQIIWHATKAEPKDCLLTFVEIFMLKFLSDNLPAGVLPQRFRFDSLLADEATFRETHGKLQVDYYVSDIRPQIKNLFPDNTIVTEPGLPEVFGLRTLVSKTSVINGFVFLRSSDRSLSAFNRTFVDILAAFQRFGPLTAIDPEFKLRLYETFLRRSARQQRLGQFFTPETLWGQWCRWQSLTGFRRGRSYWTLLQVSVDSC